MKSESHSGLGHLSAWVRRWVHLIRPGGTVLDVACGSGRHFRWLAEKGFRVTGIDRDGQSLMPLKAHGRIVEADMESGPWPLPGARFDAVLVTNYLWRPLLHTLAGSLTEGGVWIYETFAQGNESVGRPSRPDFLLRHKELLEACADLQVVAYESGYLENPPRFVQRIVAVRGEDDASAAPTRYALDALSGLEK